MTDNYYIFTWWFFLFLVGILSTPLTYLIFKKFRDGGYGFAKALGILIISYASFFLSTIHLVPFERISLILLTYLFLFLNLFLFLRNKDTITSFLKENYLVIVLEEFLFIGGLCLWAYVRSFQADINGLEKFMDYGFVNSILQSSKKTTK